MYVLAGESSTIQVLLLSGSKSRISERSEWVVGQEDEKEKSPSVFVNPAKSWNNSENMAGGYGFLLSRGGGRAGQEQRQGTHHVTGVCSPSLLRNTGLWYLSLQS